MTDAQYISIHVLHVEDDIAGDVAGVGYRAISIHVLHVEDDRPGIHGR